MRIPWAAPRLLRFEGDAVKSAAERLGFEADESQARVLRSAAKRSMLACSRQWGKSTVAAVNEEGWFQLRELPLAETRVTNCL